MPDEYVEVKRIGWGKNIVNSIVGVFIGIIMFIVSFVVLWTNEGRVNMGKVAETSIVINPALIESSAEGKLIALTGPMETTTPLGDPAYLKSGKYVLLKRIVEMFAWIEETETKTEKKVGGATEEKTVYRYKKDWTDSPEETHEFKYPEGHENPVMTVKGQTFTVPIVKIGVYNFDPQSATLPNPKPLFLTNQNIILTAKAKLIGSEYIFTGKDSYAQPSVGDLRISFETVHPGETVTLLGKKQGENIVAYLYKGKDRLFRALSGTRDEAIAQLKTEHKIIGWILRIVGFLLMWIGMNLIFGPISAVLDVLPFLGSVGRGLIGVITFIIALVLSIITILISVVFHNTVALIILLILVAVLIFLLLGRKKKPTQAG